MWEREQKHGENWERNGKEKESKIQTLCNRPLVTCEVL